MSFTHLGNARAIRQGSGGILTRFPRLKHAHQETRTKRLIQTRYAKNDKLTRLYSLNTQLDILRYQTRLLYDFELISDQRYKYINEQFNGIGSDLGLWIKQQQKR